MHCGKAATQTTKHDVSTLLGLRACCYVMFLYSVFAESYSRFLEHDKAEYPMLEQLGLK